MGLISTFVDAFRRAAGKQPKSDAELKELSRSSGGSLGSAPASAGSSFDPMQRPTPESQTGEVQAGDVSVTGDMSVGSGDPEEDGEGPVPAPPGSSV